MIQRRVAVLFLIAVSALACNQDQSRARKALTADLEGRRTRQHRAALLYDKAMNSIENDDLVEAESLMKEATQLDDQDPQRWVALGNIEFQREHLFDAAQSFDRAAKLAPGRYEPLYDLGLVYESVNQTPRAIREYEAALQLVPDDMQVMENLARCKLKVGDTKDARQLMERALNWEQRPEWRTWLRLQILRLDLQENAPATQPSSQPATTTRASM